MIKKYGQMLSSICPKITPVEQSEKFKDKDGVTLDYPEIVNFFVEYIKARNSKIAYDSNDTAATAKASRSLRGC